MTISNKFRKFDEWLSLILQTYDFNKRVVGWLRIAYRVGYNEGRRHEKASRADGKKVKKASPRKGERVKGEQ